MRRRSGNGVPVLRVAILILISSSVFIGCRMNTQRNRLPSEVESAINTVADDIAQERYDKVYDESSELWKQDVSKVQSAEILKTLRTRLGKVETRTLHSATQQQNSGGVLKGNVYVVTYQTKFELGEGMETYTLVDRDGRWLLARYLVNSTALKQ
jgi:Protein of unknown function (DUF4019)